MKLDSMSEDQLTRFEFFVRSHFPRAKIKEIIMAKLGTENSKVHTAYRSTTKHMYACNMLYNANAHRT